MFSDIDFDTSENFIEIDTDSMDLSDTESDSSYSEFGSPNLINDTHFFSHNNNFANQDVYDIFDTKDFPMTLFDIEEELEKPSYMIKVENIKIEKTEDSLNNNNNSMEGAEEMIQTLMVPVIVTSGQAETEKYLSYKSDGEESHTSDCSSSSSLPLTEEDDSPAETEAEVPQRWSSRAHRKPRRRYTTDDSDEDYRPEDEEPVRKKASQSGGRRKHGRFGERRKMENYRAPVPQRRKAGSEKISQWILNLLQNPEYNPKVIAWDNEEEGVFFITDTAKYAKLWGERKKNNTMNYEKLSRAMRYYYKNGELEQVDKRTTYKFGSKADYWRTSHN